jgi:hypothetical protein
MAGGTEEERKHVVLARTSQRYFNADDREDHGDEHEGDNGKEADFLPHVGTYVPEQLDRNLVFKDRKSKAEHASWLPTTN